MSEPKLVLINPSVKPEETLLKYDNVIDLDYTRRHFADSAHIIEIDEDGHRFSKCEKYRYVFERAYNNFCEVND